MVAWKVADALEQLRRQLNELAPHRSTASDGGIGNAEHASRDSDHNPWWTFAGQAYVTARDFTHDPAGGLDCGWLAGTLQANRDQRVKYVIYNRRIMAGAGGPAPWAWRAYGGTNAHTHHLHLSVVDDARALSAIPWLLTSATAVRPAPPVREDDDMDQTQAAQLAEIHHELTQRLTNRRGPQGEPLPNGGADTVLGYAANADGFGYRESWTLNGIQNQLDAITEHLNTQAGASAPVIDYDQLASALLRQIAGGTPR